MRQVFSFVRQMGPGWVARRASYSLRRQTGWFERRFPLSDWARYRFDNIAPDLPPDRLMERLEEASERFFISPKNKEQRRDRLNEILSKESINEIIREAEAARAGVFRFFSHKDIEMGWPPRWHQHPESKIEWPPAHWNNLPDMGEQDVKWLWETGRFTIAYTLARAYILTDDNRHAETFWQLLESFRRENLPNAGAHWMCGQECAIRSLACCFALFAMLDAPATTCERAQMMIEMLAAHAERIEGNIGFALLQKNNHAINEALGLWTIGVMFPFLRSAARWEEKGREILERESMRQIYDDGSYVQHSMNYHRLILQSYSWAALLGEACGREFSPALREQLSLAARFLYQTTDESGRAPNYGSNDGATLFRLDSVDFGDYRPAIALAVWASEKKRIYPRGPQDEPIAWMSGEEIIEHEIDPPARIDLAAEAGGYYT
ncbi:MAG TPA: heparinase II/III family protein, partial [Blastocatellia bacterium]